MRSLGLAMPPACESEEPVTMHERRRGASVTSRSESAMGRGDRAGQRPLDEVDRRLLASLTEDARASAAELARRVGMSAPAVRERIARLEEAGVIRGYRLDVAPAALGLPVAAWVRIRPGPGQLPKVTELAARLPEVS